MRGLLPLREGRGDDISASVLIVHLMEYGIRVGRGWCLSSSAPLIMARIVGLRSSVIVTAGPQTGQKWRPSRGLSSTLASQVAQVPLTATASLGKPRRSPARISRRNFIHLAHKFVGRQDAFLKEDAGEGHDPALIVTELADHLST